MEWSNLTRRTYQGGMDAVSVKWEDSVEIFERRRLMKGEEWSVCEWSV